MTLSEEVLEVALLRGFLRPVGGGGGGGGGVTQAGGVTRLGGVTWLSIQALILSLHLSCKRDQIKMSDYMDRRITSPTWGSLTL